jgi:hypothetical protein
MAILFLLLALILFAGGGAGLFYVNVNLEQWSALWVCGNLTFGVFLAVGVVVLIFLALFNAQFE